MKGMVTTGRFEEIAGSPARGLAMGLAGEAAGRQGLQTPAPRLVDRDEAR